MNQSSKVDLFSSYTARVKYVLDNFIVSLLLCCAVFSLLSHSFIIQGLIHIVSCRLTFIHKVLDQYAIRYLFPDDGDGESALANDDDDDDK